MVRRVRSHSLAVTPPRTCRKTAWYAGRTSRKWRAWERRIRGKSLPTSTWTRRHCSRLPQTRRRRQWRSRLSTPLQWCPLPHLPRHPSSPPSLRSSGRELVASTVADETHALGLGPHVVVCRLLSVRSLLFALAFRRAGQGAASRVQVERKPARGHATILRPHHRKTRGKSLPTSTWTTHALGVGPRVVVFRGGRRRWLWTRELRAGEQRGPGSRPRKKDHPHACVRRLG